MRHFFSLVEFITTIAAFVRVLLLMMRTMPKERRLKEIRLMKEKMHESADRKSVRPIRDYLLRKL